MTWFARAWQKRAMWKVERKCERVDFTDFPLLRLLLLSSLPPHRPPTSTHSTSLSPISRPPWTLSFSHPTREYRNESTIASFMAHSRPPTIFSLFPDALAVVIRHVKFTNEALAVLALVNREASCFFLVSFLPLDRLYKFPQPNPTFP